MMQCPTCGKDLKRTHRRALQRLLYSDSFICPKCGYRRRRLRPFLRVNATFLFSRYSHCIRCGSAHVHRLTKRDRVDSMSKHPFSLLQHLVGAPVNKCTACRLQYHDWRRPQPQVE